MATYLSRWDFTYFSDDEKKYMAIKEWFNHLCSKYVFQYEETKEGKKHYQGRLCVVKKASIPQLVKLAEGGPIAGCHWSPTSDGATNNFNYVMKLQSRIAGPWCDVAIETLPPDLEGIVLYPWQATIKKICETEKYQRTVHVLYDDEGCKGKSTLARLADYEGWAGWIPAYEEVKDMLQAVYGTGAKQAYIIDMPRGHSSKKMWMGVEQIKNGTIIDARHKFKKLRIPIPVVWVFTNKLPDLSKLSTDRWKLWNIEALTNYQWPPAALRGDKDGDKKMSL